MKTPERTLFWARRCVFIEREARAIQGERSGAVMRPLRATLEAERLDLLNYCRDSKVLAEAEGYDDTATYIQHILDDLSPSGDGIDPATDAAIQAHFKKPKP